MEGVGVRQITLARFNWTIIQFFFSQREKARERGFGLLSLSDGLSLPNKSPHFSPAIAQYCLLLLRQHDVAMLSVSIWYACQELFRPNRQTAGEKFNASSLRSLILSKVCYYCFPPLRGSMVQNAWYETSFTIRSQFHTCLIDISVCQLLVKHKRQPKKKRMLPKKLKTEATILITILFFMAA